jgi:hypothetical protein
MNGFVYRKLQESNNILNLNSLIRVNDKFYYNK